MRDAGAKLGDKKLAVFLGAMWSREVVLQG